MATMDAATQIALARGTLARLGDPVTDASVTWLRRWFARENTAAAFNPLASTQPLAGSTRLPGNTAGVQEYADLQTGVTATAATIANGNYPSIQLALASGDPASWDSAGLLATDFHTWSAGPKAAWSKGYKTVVDTPPRDVIGKGGGAPSGSLGLAGDLGLASGIPGMGWLTSGGQQKLPNPLKGVDLIGQSMAQIVGAIAAASRWVADRHNWVRIAEVAGGLVAVVLGVKMLAAAGGGPLATLAAVPVNAAEKAGKTAAVAAAAA